MNNNYVGFGRRLAASLVDFLVLTAISYVVLSILGVLGISSENRLDGTSNVNYGLSLLISIAYYVFFQHQVGQTIGKKVLGIKVVDEKGQTPSYITLFLREIIGKFVSAIILGIGYLMIIWDSKKQGLHDKIAGTYVVKV